MKKAILGLILLATLTTTKAQTEPTKEKTPTTQCKGMTKTGAHCKHLTHNKNGYCFQHQPKTTTPTK